MAASSSANAKGQRLMTLVGHLGNLRFFTISVALHFVLVLTFGGVALFKQPAVRADFNAVGGSLVVLVPGTGPPPAQPINEAGTAETSPGNVPPAATADPAATPPPGARGPTPEIKAAPPSRP